jgi:signal transduction histidine kinase
MMSELLEDEELPKEKRQEFLRSLQNSLGHTERLVLSLLKIAKLDSGTVEFKRESVSAYNLIAAAASSLNVMLEDRGQKLQIQGQDIAILCDKIWSAEALANVIKNAGEHSPDGGFVEIESGENTLYAWISVTDSGKGITREQLPRLFERFQSANNRGGIGIGLNMARTIMRNQGGDIEVTLPNTFTLKFYK